MRSSDHHLGELKEQVAMLVDWICSRTELVMVLVCNGDSLPDVLLLWLCNSCSPFSLMASPLAPPSRVPAPLYVPLQCRCICVHQASKSLKSDEPLKMWFLSVLDRVLCTMTCTAANALPPRRTCWSVFSSVVLLLLLMPLPPWQCTQTNLCGLF